MRRTYRLAFMGAVAVAATAPFFGSPAAAGSGPDLYIDIPAVDGCTTNQSPPPAEGEVVCTIEQGDQFTVRGVIRTLDGLADLNENTVAGYAGMQFRFFYSDGLLHVDRPGETELGPPAAPYWPDCSIRAEFNSAGALLPSCLISGEGESTYVGRAVEVDFVCASAGRHTVTLDESFSYLHNEFHGTAAEGDGDEVLTIECVARSSQPGTPDPAAPDPSLLQPTSSDSADLPTAGNGPTEDGGGSGAAAAIAAAGATAGILAVAGAFLLARRRRRE